MSEIRKLYPQDYLQQTEEQRAVGEAWELRRDASLAANWAIYSPAARRDRAEQAEREAAERRARDWPDATGSWQAARTALAAALGRLGQVRQQQRTLAAALDGARRTEAEAHALTDAALAAAADALLAAVAEGSDIIDVADPELPGGLDGKEIEAGIRIAELASSKFVRVVAAVEHEVADARAHLWRCAAAVIEDEVAEIADEHAEVVARAEALRARLAAAANARIMVEPGRPGSFTLSAATLRQLIVPDPILTGLANPLRASGAPWQRRYAELIPDPDPEPAPPAA